MQWIFLSIAIVSEVVGISALKASEGFSRLWPSVVVVLGCASAFYFLSLHRDRVAINATHRQGLEDKDACIAGWQGFGKVARIHRREEIDPVIHVFGDSVVVPSNFAISFDMNVRTLHSSGRDMFFLVREGERW